jgi:hypothetical protein
MDLLPLLLQKTLRLRQHRVQHQLLDLLNQEES